MNRASLGLLFAALLGSCVPGGRNNAKDVASAEERLASVLAVASDFSGGVAEMGFVQGEASIFVKGKSVRVEYEVMMEKAAEMGTLHDLRLQKGGADATYRIVGDWKNDDPTVGSGQFLLCCSSDEHPLTIKCKISSAEGAWAYYKFVDLPSDAYARVVEILKDEQAASELVVQAALPEESAVEEAPTIEEMTGRWVSASSDCHNEGGLWIHLSGDSLTLSGWEWTGTATEIRKETDRIILQLRIFEEGNESQMEAELGLREGHLTLDAAFRKYCCDGMDDLIRCQADIHE